MDSLYRLICIHYLFHYNDVNPYYWRAHVLNIEKPIPAFIKSKSEALQDKFENKTINPSGLDIFGKLHCALGFFAFVGISSAYLVLLLLIHFLC